MVNIGLHIWYRMWCCLGRSGLMEIFCDPPLTVTILTHWKKYSEALVQATRPLAFHSRLKTASAKPSRSKCLPHRKLRAEEARTEWR